jgi:prevent-host-death family protein
VTKVAVKEAQERLPELLEEAARGEEVIITTEDGTSVVLVPQARKKRSGFGSAKDEITMSDDFFEPLEDFKDYM